MGRGLIINTVTKSNQIKGHIHGWIVGSPARAKESQNAKERDARAIEGIYDLCSISFLLVAKNSGNVPRNTPDDQDAF
jgi:hypothetical protein